tara:strand:+ start:59 stop:565 length:507 start_codon:yes stop_codon:yes gene_type:complete
MPVLHFRLTSKNQPINMSRSLHSQNLTLRRVSVVRNISIPNNVPLPDGSLVTQPPYFVPTYTDVTDDLKGGIIIDVSFFKGFEVLSNFSSNDILVPFDNTETVVDNRFEQNFANEDISLSFNVQCFDYERKDTLKFVNDIGVSATTPAAIKFIDLFFEFDELYSYNSY